MLKVTESYEDLSKLQSLTKALLDDVQLFDALEMVHSEFGSLIPFQRIGYAEVDTDLDRVTARWCKSDTGVILRNGFSAPLAGSSLRIVLMQSKPRVLNNLLEYLEHRPQSKPTQLIVREGFRSSLTVPIILNRNPIGFVFFTSREFDAFTDYHVGLSKEIALLLAMLHKNSQCLSPVPAERQAVLPPARFAAGKNRSRQFIRGARRRAEIWVR